MRLASSLFALAIIPHVAVAQQAMYRGDAAHTGVYDASATGEFGGVRWRVQTEGPVRSSPALADGVVYVGSSDGHVYALDQRTGARRWRADAGAAVTSSPAVAQGLVVVGTRDDRWLALDARSGAVRWRIAGGPDLPFPWGHESGDRWTSSPTISGTNVLLAGGDGILRLADLRTGRVRWQARTEGIMRSSPAVGSGLVVVGDVQGIVYAFDLATGAERWRFETTGHTLGSDTFGFDRRTIQSSPAIMDGRVFFGARDGWVYALDLATGREAWRFDHHVSWINTSPAVEAGRVYDGSSDAQFVQALDAATGQEVWRTRTGLTWASPAISGNTLFSVDGTGRLTALDKATGAIRWRFRTGGGLFSSPAVADGTVYFGSDDGSVYAVDASARVGLKRAVYYDSAYAGSTLIPGATDLRDWFESRDYELVDGAGLTRFLQERLADHAPSVVVFASDYLPAAVAAPDDASPLLRRWIEAGGMAVWPGVPPLLWPRDPATGARDLLHVTRDVAGRLLDVDFGPGNFDGNGSGDISDAGRALGMEPGFLSAWGANPRTVTTVLATDETGLASAWIKRLGRGAFIRIPVHVRGGEVINHLVIQAAAETREQ